MKLLVGILVLGAMSSAQATMLEMNGPLDSTLYEAQVNEEKTYFETLGDLFKVGALPNLSKISNIAWAGRCFSKDVQNEPVSAGYIFRQKKGKDVGPIGANSKAYEAFSYWKIDKEVPNYFDKMDVEQVFAAIPDLSKYAHDAKIKTNSVEIDLQATYKSNLKVSGNYLVEEISGPPLVDVGPAGKTTVGVRCYYFIPELND